MRARSLRILRPAGIALGGLLLVACFVAIGFPYERLAPRLERAIEGATGADVLVQRLRPRIALAGPVIEAKYVTFWPGTARETRIKRLRFRPALSLRALRGEPAFYVSARSNFGRGAGTLSLGAEPGFDGSFEDLDLGSPLFEELLPLQLTGRGSVEADVALPAAGPRGHLAWTLRDGSLGHGAVPLAIPFRELRGRVEARDGVLDVQALELDGPMLSATASGTIGRPGAGKSPPLDLRVKLTGVAPELREILRSVGVRTASDGSAAFQLVGTASLPEVR